MEANQLVSAIEPIRSTSFDKHALAINILCRTWKRKNALKSPPRTKKDERKTREI